MPKSELSRNVKDRNLLLSPLIGWGILLLAFILAWVSLGFFNLSAWLSFIPVAAVSAFLFWISFRILKQENPSRSILLLTLGAIIFRLTLGVIWFVALPSGGYDTDVQQAGYVMEDAYNRDVAAWDLAKSNLPLTVAFQRFSPSDQYGGLLFLSAAIYRYLPAENHLPLLIVLLTATISGLAVIFTWAFARRVWGDRVGVLAAWLLALYPEAALLGSSQMREAFTVLLVPLALYGLIKFREEASVGNVILLAVPIVLSVPVTWAFTPSFIFLLVFAYLALNDWKLLRSWKSWVILAALAAILIVVLLFFVNLNDAWLVQSAKWQAYISANASGWVARQFERLPIYGQVPFLVIYGIFRPLLPAALVDTGTPLWTVIGIWRALGWTTLLALIIYASYLAFKSKQWLKFPGALLAVSWIVTFTASYRGGGDLWDSPRYRSVFASIQIGLGAWAWVRYRETKDIWLRRAIVSMLLIIAWFVPWYLRRYTAITWPISELYQVIGLGLISSKLFVFWDWMRQK
jgi:hypothetical protein